MKLTILFLPAALLTSCAELGPDYAGPQQPEHEVAFRGANPPQSPAAPRLDRWWTRLGDSELNRLVFQAESRNLNVQIAAERLRESRALRGQAKSTFFPQIAAEGGYSTVGLSRNTGDGGGRSIRAGLSPDEFDQWDAGADVSWELDLFGGNRRTLEASEARAGAAAESVQAARLAAMAEVVETYYTIVGQRELLERVKNNITLQERTLALVVELDEGGLGNKFDVNRARAQLGATRAAAPSLQSGIAVQTRRLALLLGDAATALDGRLERIGSFPLTLPVARTGLPAELVTRRPDLRIAERQLAAATAEIGVAAANFYPRFFLLGGANQSAASTANLFDASSLAWQFAPRVQWSIFSGGRNRALLEGANSRQRQAMLAYDMAVLAAIGEVENELTSLQSESSRLALLSGSVRDSRQALEFAQERYAEGDGDLLEVLVEQQRLNVAEVDEVRSKTALILDWVRLHKALGGGL